MDRHENQRTRFGLIRHMETVWNRERRIQGQADSPLTASGMAMARQAGKRLKTGSWDRIITSDLGRAVETGRLINETLGLPLTTEPALRELDWGAWTGQSLAQVRESDPRRLALLEDDFWHHGPPGGETRQQLYLRTRAALLSAAGRHPGEKILAVVHRGVLKALFEGGLAASADGSSKMSGIIYPATSDGRTLQIDPSLSTRIVP